jgi:hypothetical protein
VSWQILSEAKTPLPGRVLTRDFWHHRKQIFDAAAARHQDYDNQWVDSNLNSEIRPFRPCSAEAVLEVVETRRFARLVIVPGKGMLNPLRTLHAGSII